MNLRLSCSQLNFLLIKASYKFSENAVRETLAATKIKKSASSLGLLDQVGRKIGISKLGKRHGAVVVVCP